VNDASMFATVSASNFQASATRQAVCVLICPIIRVMARAPFTLGDVCVTAVHDCPVSARVLLPGRITGQILDIHVALVVPPLPQ